MISPGQKEKSQFECVDWESAEVVILDTPGYGSNNPELKADGEVKMSVATKNAMCDPAATKERQRRNLAERKKWKYKGNS